MDNALFHYSERIEQLCDRVGVKLIYLPPYSLDLNPIKEFFAKLKQFIKKKWSTYTVNLELEFNTFLEWCVDMVGGKEGAAKGHFRHAGLTIKELEGKQRHDRAR